MEFRGTSGKWYADIRSGCCAVYPENRKDDSNGINPDDDRNIYYSDKDAFYDVDYGYWTMNEESQANALLISKSPILLQAIYDSIKPLKDAGLKEMADYHEKIYIESIDL